MTRSFPEQEVAFALGLEAALESPGEQNPFPGGGSLADAWDEGYRLGRAVSAEEDPTSWMEYDEPVTSHNDIDTWPYDIPW